MFSGAKPGESIVVARAPRVLTAERALRHVRGYGAQTLGRIHAAGGFQTILSILKP